MLSVSPFQLLNQMTDIHKIRYKCYGTVGHLYLILYFPTINSSNTVKETILLHKC